MLTPFYLLEAHLGCSGEAGGGGGGFMIEKRLGNLNMGGEEKLSGNSQGSEGDILEQGTSPEP